MSLGLHRKRREGPGHRRGHDLLRGGRGDGADPRRQPVAERGAEGQLAQELPLPWQFAAVAPVTEGMVAEAITWGPRATWRRSVWSSTPASTASA